MAITELVVHRDTARVLIDATLEWGHAKGIMDNGDATRQALKMVSEVGEFVDELLKGDMEKAKMEMGDILVTCILTSAKAGFDVEDALAAAYDKISKRTGKTVNGVFVKD